jgi:hypothetical protein
VNGIAGALAVNTSVKQLNISNCSMTNAGAIEIADALAVNSTLKVLKMNCILVVGTYILQLKTGLHSSLY